MVELRMPAAMFNIASMLETGEGVAYNKIKAYKFYLLLHISCFAPFAPKALEGLGTMASPEQLAATQLQAENFIQSAN